MLTPTLFIGHGNPMYAIEQNEFSHTWAELGKTLPTPSAILSISAHWETNGTQVTAMARPQTIHDFGGFPRELFETLYMAHGSPKLAEHIKDTLPAENIALNTDWGLDHGTWSILRNMYPKADIPVIQLSVDRTKSPLQHYELGKKLAFLRKENVMIIGSGNIVHNLHTIDWQNPHGAHQWATVANNRIKSLIESADHNSLINFFKLGEEVRLAIPTPEHYIPLLYILALQSDTDKLSFFNDNIEMGALSMTSILCK
jgi:4,5-DOPA dioxygenase extradiol